MLKDLVQDLTFLDPFARVPASIRNWRCPVCN